MPERAPRAEFRRASIADVAKLAGCAPATVSRRLNNPSVVSPQVVEAIDSAIKQLGYVRNASARFLRSSRSQLVGAIIPTLRHSIYAEMLAGLQHILDVNGFALIYNTSEFNLEDEYKQARTLVERGVEAVVLVGTFHRPKTFALLSSHGITCAVTYALQDDFGFTSVGFDNHRAAAMAANKLHDLGHRRFGMLSGVTAGNDRAQARVDGFVQALGARGIERSAILIHEAPYRIGAGRAAMASLLDENSEITALFCGSDVLAIGAMFECRQRGIMAPDDPSIVGFDNLEISGYVDPPLTTLNVPAYEMGVEVGQYIVRNEPGGGTPRRIELNIEYVERGTTAAPRKRLALLG